MAVINKFIYNNTIDNKENYVALYTFSFNEKTFVVFNKNLHMLILKEEELDDIIKEHNLKTDYKKTIKNNLFAFKVFNKILHYIQNTTFDTNKCNIISLHKKFLVFIKTNMDKCLLIDKQNNISTTNIYLLKEDDSLFKGNLKDCFEKLLSYKNGNDVIEDI